MLFFGPTWGKEGPGLPCLLGPRHVQFSKTLSLLLYSLLPSFLCSSHLAFFMSLERKSRSHLGAFGGFPAF